MISYAQALSYPGDAGIAVRTAEWVRDNGGGGLVDLAENLWYSRPSGGSAAPDPALGYTGQAAAARTAPNAPAALPVLAGVAPLRGEGLWIPRAAAATGIPALYTTFIRPDPQYPNVIAGVARFDQSLTRTDLIAGTRQPDLSTTAPAKVPDADRASLVATFNSGFKMKDARGGFFLRGRTIVPLRDGAASLVIRQDGRATIAQWSRDAAAGPDVTAVRQNLDLIVDGGHPVSGLDTNAGGTWGSSGNQLQYTWRSGLGEDAAGDLVYVGGANLTLATLAKALTSAGAVRGMELDIHSRMVDFNGYQHAGGELSSTKLLPDMPNGDTRYLVPDQRDFVAVTLQ
ncbi:phosphodiester glycosidase family protein [Pseudonocardia yunnanensis]